MLIYIYLYFLVHFICNKCKHDTLSLSFLFFFLYEIINFEKTLGVLNIFDATTTAAADTAAATTVA